MHGMKLRVGSVTGLLTGAKGLKLPTPLFTPLLHLHLLLVLHITIHLLHNLSQAYNSVGEKQELRTEIFIVGVRH